MVILVVDAVQAVKMTNARGEMKFPIKVDVKVSIPSEMVMLQKHSVETVVGTYLQVAVTMRASDGSYIYSCDSFGAMVKCCGSDSFKIFNVTGETRSLIELLNVDGLKSVYGLPCAQSYTYASSVGRTLLQATLQIERQSYGQPPDGRNVLKASSRIALVAQQNGNGKHFGGHSADLPREWYITVYGFLVVLLSSGGSN